MVLSKDKRVGDYLRVYVGATSDVHREFVLHRPIGLTDLQDDDWVMSEPSDIPILLSRSEDPNKKVIADQRANWLIGKAVEATLLKAEKDGSIVYNSSNPTSRSEFFSELKSEFEKNERKGSKSKFDLLSALNKSTDPRAGVELRIRDLFSKRSAEADGSFPSTYRTLGGVRGDQPQVALSWARGLKIQEVADVFIKHGVNGPPIAGGPRVGGYARKVPVDDISVLTKGSEANPNQWCFLPDGLDKTIRKDVHDKLRKVRNIVNSKLGGEFIIQVLPVKGDK